VVDGTGLKNTLENRLAPFIDSRIGGYVVKEKKALVTAGVDRWGMTKSFLDGGYECIFGDLMFGLGIPIPIRSESTLKTLAALLMPVVGRVPFEWIYLTGGSRKATPKTPEVHNWAAITGIATIRRHA
jgi:hypothetical protein